MTRFSNGIRLATWLERPIQLTPTWLIVAGVFCSTILVPFLSQRQVMLLLGALIGIGLTSILLHKPILGVVAIVPVCLLVPFEIGTGTNSGLNAGILFLILLLGFWLLDVMVRHPQQSRLCGSRPALPLLLLVLAAVMAFLGGQLPWFDMPGAPLPAQIGGLSVFVLSAGAFLLVAYRVRDLRWLQWITWLFLAIGAIYTVARLIPSFAGVVLQYIQSDATGSLFWTWLAALAFGQALLNRHLSSTWRWLLLGLVVALFYLGIAQNYGWKSGYIPPLVAVAAIIGLRLRYWVLLAVPLAIWAASSFVPRLVASDEYSYNTRIEAWQILLQMLKGNPLLGFGPANYHFYTPLYAIRGYYVQFNSHNQYVDLLLQTGILGLACFLWFAWEVGWLGWRLRTQVPPGFAQAYVYGALGGLVGTLTAGMLGDWVLPFVYNVGLDGFRDSVIAWIFLGGLVTLEQMKPENSELAESNSPA